MTERPKKPQAQSVARTPRRGRPPVVSTEALLDAAREVFLERGIRATTLEVAERAGVSEGTLFHRFKTKEALFREAMRFDPSEPPPVLERLGAIVGEGDLRANLVRVATELVEVGRIALPVMMMSWSNPSDPDGFATLVRRRADGYQRSFQSVCAFFEGEVEAGRLHATEPEALARIFIGSLHHYCMSELLRVEGQKARLGASAFVHALVDALLKAGSYVERERGPSRLQRKLRRV